MLTVSRGTVKTSESISRKSITLSWGIFALAFLSAKA
jgi:hypothetical protein